MPKAQSSYFYFTLEANGGIAFYSTLNESIDNNHRDVLVHGPIELIDQFKQILDSLGKYIEIETIKEEVVQDNPDYHLEL